MPTERSADLFGFARVEGGRRRQPLHDESRGLGKAQPCRVERLHRRPAPRVDDRYRDTWL